MERIRRTIIAKRVKYERSDSQQRGEAVEPFSEEQLDNNSTRNNATQQDVNVDQAKY